MRVRFPPVITTYKDLNPLFTGKLSASGGIICYTRDWGRRMKCKDCKYFKLSKYEDGDNDCSSPKFVYEDRESDDQLVYADYEGYSAGFSVGPNFGCIHFEPKGT